jgi:hypothetical protein
MRASRYIRYPMRTLGIALLLTACLVAAAHVALFRLEWLIALNARSENDPFSFEGQVVDIDGKPLEGVSVRAIIKSANALAMVDGKTSRRSELLATTDVNGRFALRGSGTTIAVVEVSKPGYEWIWELEPGRLVGKPSANNTVYHLSEWRPDAANLPVYPMRVQGDTRNAAPSRGGFDRLPGGIETDR